MKNLNSMENTLRSFKPRRPSDDLARRIFTAPTAPASEGTLTSLSFGDFSRWLVPAMSCFLVALASLGTHTADPYLIGSTNDLLPESHKAQYSAYVAAPAFHSEMNSVPVTRVESSLGMAATGVRSVIQFTNSLIR